MKKIKELKVYIVRNRGIYFFSYFFVMGNGGNCFVLGVWWIRLVKIEFDKDLYK